MLGLQYSLTDMQLLNGLFLDNYSKRIYFSAAMATFNLHFT